MAQYELYVDGRKAYEGDSYHTAVMGFNSYRSDGQTHRILLVDDMGTVKLALNLPNHEDKLN